MKDPTWSQTLLNLLSLALRLEAEGQYNLAKIARAKVDSLSRRKAWEMGASSNRESILRDIKLLLPKLDEPDLRTAFEKGVSAMGEGRLPLLDEIPHPFVCRTCGYFSFQPLPNQCPDCGAWASTFQKFQPIYWLDEFEPSEALESLRETPQIVEKFLKGLDQSILLAPAEDGGWSIHQVVSHLSDAQGVIASRVTQFMEEENPILQSKAVFAWAFNQNDRPHSTREIFNQYLESRSAMIGQLEHIPSELWERIGIHDEFGEVSLKQQVSYFSAHELTHLRQIDRLVKREKA